MPGEPVERMAVHGRRLCIVMVCQDQAEAAQAGQTLLQVNTGSLITYRRSEDVLTNSPTGRVSLIVLSSNDDPEAMGKILEWMRRRWPESPVVVIGDTGAGEAELAARKGGASYLVRPVGPEQWEALIGHAVKAYGRATTEERLG